jgi:dolichol-phosphate mannosyltransferase
VQRAFDDRCDWELLFVDDDSPDGTAEVVRRLARTDARVRLVRRIERRGLSSACLEGMLATSAPYVAVMDGDLQHDERLLPRMLEVLRDDGAKLVVGSRYAAGGSRGDWDARRSELSRIATRLARRLAGVDVADPTSGLFMLRRDLLEERVRAVAGVGFKLLFDLLTAAGRSVRLVELPYEFRARRAGESKLDARVAWEFFVLLVVRASRGVMPARFVAYACVGAEFTVAQSGATLAAMVWNFRLNNLLTFRDRRRTGRRWLTGLLAFVLVCSVGAVANVGVASYLFVHDARWGLAGVLVGAVFNFAVAGTYI